MREARIPGLGCRDSQAWRMTVKKLLALIFALLLCLFAGASIAGPAKKAPVKPGKSTLEVKPQPEPTKEGVLELADKYIKL